MSKRKRKKRQKRRDGKLTAALAFLAFQALMLRNGAEYDWPTDRSIYRSGCRCAICEPAIYYHFKFAPED